MVNPILKFIGELNWWLIVLLVSLLLNADSPISKCNGPLEFILMPLVEEVHSLITVNIF